MAFNFLNTDWRTGMQSASEAIDEKLGEDLIITQSLKRPNFDAIPDPATAFPIRGVFSLRSETIFRAGAEGGTTIESRKPMASLSRGALPWALQRGDVVQRDCDGTVYQVTAVQPDGVSRITCTLVQQGLESQ